MRQPTNFFGLCCANLRGHIHEDLLTLLGAVLRMADCEIPDDVDASAAV